MNRFCKFLSFNEAPTVFNRSSIAARQKHVFMVLIGAVLLPFIVPVTYGQTQITAVSTTSQTVSSSSYSVNSKTVNHGAPAPGNDLRLDGFTANSLVFDHEMAADQIVIRRYDPPSGGPTGTPFGTKHTVYNQGTYSSNIANIPTERVLSEEEALFNRALNRGSNNTFDNNRGAVTSNNIERIDFIFNAGVSVTDPQLTLAGFPVFERSGGNTFGIAAITSLNGGVPDGYGPLVSVSNNTGPTLVADFSYVDFKQEDGETLLEPISQGSPQGIKGVFVSFQDLGITAGQTLYGYSLFGEDVTGSHNLVNYQSFPKTETGGADLVGGGHFFLETNETLPVELTTFEALVDGRDVQLTWETASETNNAGFFVEMKENAGSLFQQHGFVEGFGTTAFAQSYQYRVEALDPGRYTFRLKQIDFDGTFEYHPEVEVVVEIARRFLLEPVYPNPFNPSAQFQFAVMRRQAVRVDLYDMQGQRVKTLYEGVPSPGQMQTVYIDGQGLSSGAYVVRLTGAQFVKSQTVTLLK